jgi:hypothetical protein
MKRRMSFAERIALEEIARPVVSFFVERSLEMHHIRRTAQSMMRLVQEILQRGCAVRFSATDSLRLSPSQQWVASVEWVLQQLARDMQSPAAPYVLVFRLSRSQKTESSSFGRIARDVNDMFERAGRGDVEAITTEEAEAMYRTALVQFVEQLRARSIGRDVHQPPQMNGNLQPLDPDVQRGLISVGRKLQRFIQATTAASRAIGVEKHSPLSGRHARLSCTAKPASRCAGRPH